MGDGDPVVTDGQRASQNADVVIVSNRLPVRVVVGDETVELQRSSGGLAAALASLTNLRAWVGWAGAAVDDTARPRIVAALERQRLQPVFLDAAQERGYYDGMCNSVLWPLLHYFPGKVDLHEDHWRDYIAVNQRFAEATAAAARPGDVVWIQDFHLMLVPSQLRALRPDLRIGFFLHVPFPSSELWRLLPQREQLLRGVLGADHIDFHTADYLRHFRNACLRVLGIESNADAIPLGTRNVQLGAHPVGTDVGRFQRELGSPATAVRAQELAATWHGRRLILGVERLDYTKGVPAKFRACSATALARATRSCCRCSCPRARRTAATAICCGKSSARSAASTASTARLARCRSSSCTAASTTPSSSRSTAAPTRCSSRPCATA
jgi:trehalose 6-phosphate synthase/phosphatase